MEGWEGKRAHGTCFNFVFSSLGGKKGGGQQWDSGARENDGSRFTCPDWQIVRYKKNFIDAVSLQCEGAAAGVAGAAKVA